MLLLGSLLGRVTKAQPEPLSAFIQKAEHAGASGELMRAVADRGREAGLSSESTIRLLRPALDLAKQDYPTKSVLVTALEGMSKQVPPQRLLATLDGVHGRTERAGTLVSGWLRGREGLSPEEDARLALIENAARAQQRGFSPSELERVWSVLTATEEDRSPALSAVATAFEVLPELPGSERSPTIAGRLLKRALDAGYSATEMRQLPTALRPEGIRRMPSAALSRRATRLVGKGASAAEVRQNLSVGEAPFGPGKSDGPQMGESPGPIGTFGLDRVRTERRPPGDRPPPSNGPS